MSMIGGQQENESIDAQSDSRSNLSSDSVSIPTSLIESLRDKNLDLTVQSNMSTSLKSYIAVSWSTTESDNVERLSQEQQTDSSGFSSGGSLETISTFCSTNFDCDILATDEQPTNNDMESLSSFETLDESDILTDFSCDDFYCPEYSSSSTSCELVTAVDEEDLRI
ncbi:hypothetical protein M3Y94_00638900 [Aphelenchoides besseyi]|nr:hypothetical protein M3Y94_00638900 [Aphelenchoides besseyi]KAI6231004.1 hypothetical protein M3Y95_00335800 [Aphelenchoides besseyi]